DIPGRGGSARSAAHLEARALAERIQGESAVLADHLAAGTFNRTSRGGEMAAQEVLEWPLADEADAGAVRLVEYAQASRVGAAAHFVFAQFADRKHGARKCRGCDPVQKIALILRAVRSLEELRAVVGAPQSGVMPGRDP